MSVENGEWVMYGLDRDDPNCVHSPKDVIKLVNQIGFLPLFGNEIDGFSLEEHTAPEDWFSGDEEIDPWLWREEIARSGKVAYGKFFGKKAGFVSKKWFPYFANMRRDGYDFDARWDDQMASHREKKIMDLFEIHDTLLSHEIKTLARFGTDGEKGFDGTITNLQMQTYLCIRDFKRKKSKAGQEYGLAVALYCTPEHLWGRDHITSAYSETPEQSAERIVSHILKRYPEVTPEQIKHVFGIGKAVSEKKKEPPRYPQNLIDALGVTKEHPSLKNPSNDQMVGLEYALSLLKEREQEMVHLKYRDGKKLEEIGALFDRSGSRAGQIISKSLRLLRQPKHLVWITEGFEGHKEKILKAESVLKEYAGAKGKDISHLLHDPLLCFIENGRTSNKLFKNGIHVLEDLAIILQNPEVFTRRWRFSKAEVSMLQERLLEYVKSRI